MPAEGAEGARIYAAQHDIDYSRTAEFFRARGAQGASLSATMYQDEELAARRDASEKSRILPLLSPSASDSVLDVGCGNGRWAVALVPKVSRYIGIDWSEGLIEAARQRVPGGDFHVVAAHQFTPAMLPDFQRVSIVILSGILAYINDADAAALLRQVAASVLPAARIYVREPVAKQVRLTLDGFWSEQLGAPYSAIYRTADEYRQMLADSLGAGFSICREGSPIDDHLQNRTETEQRFFLLGR